MINRQVIQETLILGLFQMSKSRPGVYERVHKSKKQWSGPVVHVASGLQKLMQSARKDIGDLKKAVSLISLVVYLDL